MTDDEITALTQTIEAILERYNVHLDEGGFNALDDYLTELVRQYEENGE